LVGGGEEAMHHDLTNRYDVIVMGLGGVGSAAAYHLAKRGHRVLGIDKFSPPHDRGSSHGETRIIRKAYFEHPGYVPLLCEAYSLWRELESECGKQLYHAKGIIEIGPDSGVVIPGIKRSAMDFDLPIETMTMREACRLYPMIRGDESWSVVIEKDAGYLKVEECVDAHLQQAAKHGATLVKNQKVVEWQSEGDGVVVRTETESYRAGRLIITAGPWANRWLANHHMTLVVLQKWLYWFDTTNDAYDEASGFPCFFYDTPAGYFYGFPKRDSLGLKVARHSGGAPIDDVDRGGLATDEEDRKAVESFLQSCLPDVSQRLLHESKCFYTMTPDEHFIVDRLPENDRVTIIAGLSGHGFKFASVLGKIAADSATDTSSEFDLTFLRLRSRQR
jgi:sarcosine oxidase